MHKFFSVLFVLSSLWFLPLASAGEPQLPPGMTMHRIQAGELDASGWTLAESTEGKFTVKFPFKFNDFTLAIDDSKSPAKTTFTLGGKSLEGIKFSATRIVYRQGAKAAQEFFAKMERGEGLEAQKPSIEKIDFHGLPSVNTSYCSNEVCLWQRSLLIEADLITLIIESPKQYKETVEAMTPIFFDSLEIVK